MEETTQVILPYAHDPADLRSIDIAVTEPGVAPGRADWRPAYRDTIDGRRVVWIRVPARGRRADVWLRDAAGARIIEPRRV